jgi:hypothetical protein
MRTPKTLTFLAALTLALVLVAFWARKVETPTTRSPDLVFPHLLARVNDISQVRQVRDDAVVTVTRGTSGWGVQEKHGYPADGERVRALLLGLAQLRRVEPKSRNPEDYAKLGLGSEAGSEATTLTLKAGDEKAAEVVVGKRRPAKGSDRQQLFVRLPDDPQVWLVEGKLPADQNAAGWLDSQVLKLDRGRIRAVAVTYPDGETVAVSRAAAAAKDFRLAGLAAGQAVASPAMVNAVATAFVDLACEDVKPVGEVDFAGQPSWSATLHTFDGLQVDVATVPVEDKTYARFSARVDDTAAKDDTAPDGSTDGKGKAATPAGGEGTPTASTADEGNAAALATGETKPATAGKSVQQEAADLNARWQGWAYALPAYRVTAIARHRADLVKHSEPEKKK